MPQTPGFDAECARYIAHDTPLVGVGVETVGIDAGGAGAFDPPFPVHNYLLGAGKYGVTQLANLAKLPATGALVVVAPMKLVGGTGSPVACWRSYPSPDARVRPNLTKRALRDGKPAFGCFVRFPEPALVEFAAYQGWDFLIFDGEHGTMEPRECENLVRAAELHDVTPIVRVPVNQPHVILRFVDLGSQGCQVPWVEDSADAERAVQAVKYGPRGSRGWRRAGGRLRPARPARRLRAHGQRGDPRDRARRRRPGRGAGRRDRGGGRRRRDLPRSHRSVALARRARRVGPPARDRPPRARAAAATLAAGKVLGVTVPTAEAAVE